MKPKSELVQALIQTEQKHRSEFRSTKGKDVTWAKWYANYLLINTDFQKHSERQWNEEELAEALTHLDTAFTNNQPKTSWSHYYASRLVY